MPKIRSDLELWMSGDASGSRVPPKRDRARPDIRPWWMVSGTRIVELVGTRSAAGPDLWWVCLEGIEMQVVEGVDLFPTPALARSAATHRLRQAAFVISEQIRELERSKPEPIVDEE